MRGRAVVWVGLVMMVVAVGVLAAGAQDAVSPRVQLGLPQGQVNSAQGPTGTVMGRVICSDTQRPARFAQVVLRRVPGADGNVAGGGGGTAQTGLDGTFEADGVAVGDYFVTANAAGYVSERQMVQAEVSAGMSVADILARLPVVRVSANGISSVNVTMERGGVLAGQVQWEDGSPAAGVVVTPLLMAPQELPEALQGVPFFGNPTSVTDDRGRFRMVGMAAGDYMLRANLRGPQPPVPGGLAGRQVNATAQIAVYAPGVFRRAEAKVMSVKMGEERDDVRMVINLGSLRMVSGHVGVASGTGATGGRVNLSDPNDRTVTMSGLIGANGDFVVGYVPAGTYAMQVSVGGPTLQGRGGRGDQNGGTPATVYQPVTQTVVVGTTDVTGVSITLVPVQAAP